MTSPVLRLPRTFIRYTDNHRVESLLLSNDTKGLEHLINRLGPDVRVDGDKTLLMLSAEGNYLWTTNLLCAHHADVHAKDGKARTALHHAAIWGADAIAQTLLNAGATIDPQDHSGRTPLWYAAAKHYPDSAIVDVLLTAGANSKIRDSRGINPNDLL
ncbi:ankyrin repeat domain-containing protein [Corynebacterium sp. 3HC-13]|uniref:ankyrin repeat domain-containing protein n=1 Tax=Corynebacterium poyangense TaxID=2684405 RepID=UPI001CC9EDEB|nr:ankyrin repeat domain-containing protein [Corynebacterium poyangense]MBZ8178074.1 ankyrin repeat domain-containing protein [Corynebacterium poyangense]